MKEEGWDCGQDDEELFELAMHERQYRDYKSGAAKDRFLKELAAEKAKAAVPVHAPAKGQMLWEIDVDDASSAPVVGTAVSADEPMGFIQTYYGMEEILPLTDGRIAATLAKQGENVAKGEIVAFIQK
jgi:pyruvate carboxylase subunit B